MFGIVVHGGAGTILREKMTSELEAEYRGKLAEALRAGFAVLDSGGEALDAVEAAVLVFEDCPLFNAGRGACFTAEGTHELDASVMDGRDRGAGAVAGVRHVRNPILLARRVMQASGHVMLAGEGAEQFAVHEGLELVEPGYFSTERRWQQLEAARAAEEEKTTLSEDATEKKFGTVGAVALDRAGNLAAGTSTGGMTNKRFGRIGDSPVIAAGTWADNATCAVSCTGHGEYFIRAAAAYDVAARMRYGGALLGDAAHAVVHDNLLPMGGRGGLVALDREGNYAMPFNSAGMYRGALMVGREMQVAIFPGE